MVDFWDQFEDADTDVATEAPAQPETGADGFWSQFEEAPEEIAPIDDVPRGFGATITGGKGRGEGRSAGEIAKDVGGTFLVGGAGVPRSAGESMEFAGQMVGKAAEFAREHPVAAKTAAMLIPGGGGLGLLSGLKLVDKTKQGKALEFVGRASSDFWAKAGKTTSEKAISEKGRKSTHPAWIITSGLAQTSPQLIADWITGQTAGKGVKLGASVISSAVEGNTAGSANRGEVEDAFDAMSDEDIAQLPVFVEALEKSEGNYAEARKIAKETAANRAYAQTFLATSLTSIALDKVGSGTLDKWLLQPEVGKLGLKTIIRMSGAEAGEEALQSAFETMVLNANTGKTGMAMFEGVLEAAGYGAATGAILGGGLPGISAGLNKAQSAIEGAPEAGDGPPALPPIPEVPQGVEGAVEPEIAPEAVIEEEVTPEPQRPELEALPDTGVVEAEGKAVAEEVEKVEEFEPTQEEIDEYRSIQGTNEEKRAKLAEISRNKKKAEKGERSKKQQELDKLMAEKTDPNLEVFLDEFPEVRTPDKKSREYKAIAHRERGPGGKFLAGEQGRSPIPNRKDSTLLWEDALRRAKELHLLPETAALPEDLYALYNGTIETMDEVADAEDLHMQRQVEAEMHDEMAELAKEGIRPSQELINEAPGIWSAVVRYNEIDESTLQKSEDIPVELISEQEQEAIWEDIQEERGELAEDLTLESATKEELDAEKAKTERKETIKDEAAKPLKGTAGETTADMFGEGETPLFNEVRGEVVDQEKEGPGEEGLINETRADIEAKTGKSSSEMSDAEILQIGRKKFEAEQKSKETKDAVKTADSKESKPAEAEKAEAKPVADKEKVREPGKVIGLTKTEITSARETAGLLGLEKGDTETWLSHVEEAKAKELDKKATAIANDAMQPDRRISLPEQAGLTMRMGQIEGEIEAIGDRLDAAAEAKRSPDPIDIQQDEILRDEMDLISRALNTLGSEAGRELNYRKMLLRVENFSLAKMERDVKRLKRLRAKPGESTDLTDAERAQLKEVSKQIRDAEAMLAEITAKAEIIMAQNMEELAQQAFVQEERSVKKTRRRKETIKRKLTEKKNALQRLGYKVNDITGVPIEVSKILSDMAVLHIENGARSLQEVVQAIQKDVPDISSADVFNSFGGRVKSEVKKATTEAQKAVKELRSQANKLGEIDEILTKGIEKGKKKRRDLSEENESLQKALSELREMAYQTEMDNATLEKTVNLIQKIKEQTERGYRDVIDPKRPDSDEVKAAKRELKNVRDIQKAVDIIHSLEEDLRTGNLQNTTRKQSLKISDELSRLNKRIEQLKGATTDEKRLADLKRSIESVKKQLVTGERSKVQKRMEDNEDIRVAKRELAELRNIMRTNDAIKSLEKQIETGNFEVTPARQQRIISDELERARVKLNKLKKEAKNRVASMQPMTAGEMVMELGVNLPRTLLATGDMSGTLRQGLLLSARRPVVASKAFKTSFKAFWSEHTAESVDLALKTGPMQRTRERAGLFLAGLNESMSSKEEAFMSRLASTKFFKSIGAHAVIQASERHMVTHLNLLRASIFDSYAQAHPGASDAELAAWADYINKASGRGDLKSFSSSAKSLSNVLFAPRFTVSRFQTPWALKTAIQTQPRVAKEIGKDFAGLGMLALSVLALGKLAGADVGDDPEDADWGKLIIGNTRIDVFGGFLQPFRLGALFITQAAGRAGFLTQEDPETGEISTREAKVSFKDAIWRFSQYKLAPGVQLVLEGLSGKDVVGKPTGIPEAVARKLIPIVAQGAYDTVKQGKVDELLWTVPLEFFGAGVNVYEDESSAPDIKRILKAINYKPSKPKYPSWVKHKVKAEYDIIFGQKLAQGIRDFGLTEKADISELASEIREEMLDEIPETEH